MRKIGLIILVFLFSGCSSYGQLRYLEGRASAYADMWKEIETSGCEKRRIEVGKKMVELETENRRLEFEIIAGKVAEKMGCK